MIDKKNGYQTQKALKTEDNIYLNISIVNKVLKKFRHCFDQYLKDDYKFNKLGKTAGGSSIGFDKSLFVKINGVKVWIICDRNNKTGNIKVDLFETRKRMI